MFCRKCGNKIVDDDIFCGNCGTHIIKNEATKIDEPKIISVEAADEKQEDLVNFLSHEKPKTEQTNSIHLNESEPKNDLVDFLMNEKPSGHHLDMEDSIPEEKNDSLVDFVMNDNRKDDLVDFVTKEEPKREEEKEEPMTEITSNETKFNNELISFTEEEPKKKNKKDVPIVGIIFGVIAFVVIFFVVYKLVSGSSFNLLNIFKKEEAIEDPADFETVTFDTLTLGVPSYFKKSAEDSNLLVYTAANDTCAFSISKGQNSPDVTAEYLVDASLKGSATAVNGTMRPYQVSTIDINNATWTYGETEILASGATLHTFMYVTLKNNFYGFNYSSQENPTCEKYKDLILNTIKFAEQ